MDPRDSPGYHVHRTLTHLRSIDTDELSDADNHRVQMATMLLEDVSFLSEIGRYGVTDD